MSRGEVTPTVRTAAEVVAIEMVRARRLARVCASVRPIPLRRLSSVVRHFADVDDDPTNSVNASWTQAGWS